MATMKLYELVNHYHIGTELTCAEAVFMACNEYYHLNLSEETRKMFSVMGLGMQTEQSCCGAFTVAVGIIGLMTAKEGQTDVSNMEGYQMIADLTDFTLGIYGTLHCVELQKLEIVGYENPCHAIVEALAKKLEELLAFSIPLYQREGKSQLVVAVGCTGGRHRSVAIACQLAAYLRSLGYRVELSHRDKDNRR